MRRSSSDGPRVTKIVLATRNPHKVVELREILADLVEEIRLEIVGVSEFPDVEDVVEDGVTLSLIHI